MAAPRQVVMKMMGIMERMVNIHCTSKGEQNVFCGGLQCIKEVNNK